MAFAEISISPLRQRPQFTNLLRAFAHRVRIALGTGRVATTAAAGVMGLLVLSLGAAGFAAAGLVLILLLGHTAMRYHARWQEARKACDMLRETIDALPAGVVVYDTDERLVTFNSMAAVLSPSLQRSDAIGRTYESLVRDTARQLEAAGKGPQPVDEWVARFRSKNIVRSRQAVDGRWFDWSERATPSGGTVGLRVDVTAVKNHERELERAGARYQSLVDSLSDVVYATDDKGIFTFASPAVADLLGVPAAELMGTRFRDWVVPEDVDRVLAAGRAFHHAPNPEMRQMQFRMQSADGTIRQVELRYRKPIGESREAAQVGVIRDISELERARTEYQSLVDSLADVAYTLDVKTGIYTFASAAAADLFGVPAEKIVGTHFLDYIAPDSREHVGRTTTRDYDPSDPGTFTRFRMITRGGEPRHVEVRARRRIDESGRLLSTGVIRDVEERVQLEKRLEDETARLRSIVESSGALMMLTDRDLNVLMINRGFSKFWGVSYDDLVGRPLKDTTIGTGLDPALHRRWLAGEQAEPERFTRTKLDPQGRKHIVNVTATPITDEAGAVSQIVFVGVEDTERHEAEQALHDAERFATVGEMAGTMAHEISQPLQVINIACASAREELEDAAEQGGTPDGQYVQSKLDRIAQQVECASRIVGDLRAFVRGTTADKPKPFDPTNAVQSAVNLTAYGMRQAGTVLSASLAESLPAVTGDVGRLEQVLVNLINNARDAGGRTIGITTDSVQQAERPFVRIAVEDSGTGIAPNVLPQLFVAFVTTKARGKGTGLGLRICRRIVEEMGGSISAANRDEGGARFEILLPAVTVPLGGSPEMVAD